MSGVWPGFAVGDIIPLIDGKAIDKSTVIEMIKKDVSTTLPVRLKSGTLPLKC